jgi:hypothetical protein
MFWVSFDIHLSKHRHLPIDSPGKSFHNSIMSIDTRKPLTQEEADHKHMLDHAFRGTPVDPEVRKRVHERAEKVREKLRAKGMTDVAVDLIRAHRDE